jgi:hypothetical protein
MNTKYHIPDFIDNSETQYHIPPASTVLETAFAFPRKETHRIIKRENTTKPVLIVVIFVIIYLRIVRAYKVISIFKWILLFTQHSIVA